MTGGSRGASDVGSFDFGQSDGNGIVTFDNAPVGSGYTVQVISRRRRIECSWRRHRDTGRQ
jgi:hypothetical protein